MAPTGAIEHWRALSLWDTEYLSQVVGDLEVTVDVTPNGRADAVTDYGKPGRLDS